MWLASLLKIYKVGGLDEESDELPLWSLGGCRLEWRRVITEQGVEDINIKRGVIVFLVSLNKQISEVVYMEVPFVKWLGFEEMQVNRSNQMLLGSLDLTKGATEIEYINDKKRLWQSRNFWREENQIGAQIAKNSIFIESNSKQSRSCDLFWLLLLLICFGRWRS